MVAQVKIYPYEICTVKQENQSAIQELHMGQPKIYLLELALCTKKIKVLFTSLV